MDDWLYPALRFAHYTVLLGLFGLTAFRVLGLKWLDADSAGPVESAVVAVAVAAPLVSLAQMLASIAAMMGQSLGQLEWETTTALLTGTSLGWAFMLRLALLLGAASVLLLAKRRRGAYPAAAVLFAAALATLPWSGHAAASSGPIGLLHRLVDAAHLLAAGLWIGAIAWFLFLVAKAHRASGDILAESLLSAMHRFAGLGLLLVAIIVASGGVNAQLIFGIENSGAVLDTAYGRLLMAKLGLVGAMLLLGARNALIGRHYARSAGGAKADRGATLATLRNSLAGEFVIGVSIIALVALVTMMSPMGD